MRISDWSSDVCSSDLYRLADLRRQIALVGQRVMLFDDSIGANIAYGSEASPDALRAVAEAANAWEFFERLPQGMDTLIGENGRSDEHTSEIQSIMRISYAVFRLKKKKQIKTHH